MSRMYSFSVSRMSVRGIQAVGNEGMFVLIGAKTSSSRPPSGSIRNSRSGSSIRNGFQVSSSPSLSLSMTGRFFSAIL
jgi:hypothetical protein